MSKKATIKPVAAALGAVFAASLVSMPAANADENPFGMTKLSAGYMVADSHKEGKCGGEKKSEGKCGEGKCGGEKKSEGKCGEGKCGGEKKGEGKCGEGKCGGDKK